MLFLNVLSAIIKNKLGIIQYPSFVTWLVTWRCNGRCIMCDIWKKDVDPAEELSVADAQNIFKQLKKIDVLRLTGGEPFLRDDLAEIINAIEAVNPPGLIHLTTNGFLTERIVATLKKIKPLHKIHLKISIDSVGAKHDQIRGVKGAYDRALQTVKELVKLREQTNFHLGVNQTIVAKEDIESYFQLQKILDEFKVPIYPVIANDITNSFYTDTSVKAEDISFKTFGQFSPEALAKFIKTIQADGKKISDFKEQMVDKYHLRGLYNRLIKHQNKPRPKCVALNNHLRILPNGDIPVCLFNGTVIGNLKQQKFKDIWFGQKAKAQRQWVKKCPGCWQSCESAVNGIYTGDAIRGLFY
jgi:Fe-coproporphyrin III synthase